MASNGKDLRETILGEGHKTDGHGGDEATGDRNEAADEHDKGEEADARDGESPYPNCREERVDAGDARLFRRPPVTPSKQP